MCGTDRRVFGARLSPLWLWPGMIRAPPKPQREGAAGGREALPDVGTVHTVGSCVGHIITSCVIVGGSVRVVWLVAQIAFAILRSWLPQFM